MADTHSLIRTLGGLLVGIAAIVTAGVGLYQVTTTNRATVPSESSPVGLGPEESKCSAAWVWSAALQTCVRHVTIPSKSFSIRLDQPIREVRGRIDFYLNTERLPDSNGAARYRAAKGRVQAVVPIMLGNRMVGVLREVIYSTADGEVCSIKSLPEATGWMRQMRVSYWLELTDCQGLCRASLSSPDRAQVYTSDLEATIARDCP